LEQQLSSFDSTLVEANAMLVKQLEAKDKRIRYLEFILEQRYQATVKKYDPEKIAEMCRRCYEVFLDAPAGTGYTTTEFLTAFKNKWRFQSAHLPQRLRDLVKQQKLWRAKDDKGNVRFYLKLEEVEA
jgi:hypothetical protein